MRVGEANIIMEPFVATEEIVIPPMHSKLGLMKQCAKALLTTEDCLQLKIVSTLFAKHFLLCP